MFSARKLKWPKSPIAYHRYINNNNNNNKTTSTTSTFFPCYPFTKEGNEKYEIKIVHPPVKIIRNIPLTPHKRLTLQRREDDETVYKIGNNYVKKITRKNNYEYIINNKYKLTLTDNLFVYELISFLFI